MMQIVDNGNLMLQPGVRARTASDQDFSWLDNIDIVDTVIADYLPAVAGTPQLQQQEQDQLPMPHITADDISDFLFELENMEQPSNTENSALEINRDIFEPISLSDIKSRHAIVTKTYDEQERLANFAAPKAGNSWMASSRSVLNPNNENFRKVDDESSSDEEHSHHDNYSPKFRGYQCDQWQDRYAELKEFHQQNGHSSVPHTTSSNRRLARWVKRQRYQYKLRQEGKPSAMTDDRIRLLESLGFVWDSHGAAFEDRLRELDEFKAEHKHCNVPSNYRANSSLASWVKCQRRQYRLYREGKHSNITQTRIDQLERMGFQFNLRVGYHHHQNRRSGNGWS